VKAPFHAMDFYLRVKMILRSDVDGMQHCHISTTMDNLVIWTVARLYNELSQLGPAGKSLYEGREL
jgi:hypothetical protein